MPDYPLIEVEVDELQLRQTASYKGISGALAAQQYEGEARAAYEAAAAEYNEASYIAHTNVVKSTIYQDTLANVFKSLGEKGIIEELEAYDEGLSLADFAAESKTIYYSSSAIACYVYDTRLDSDGGEWRYKVNDTSWMRETLNTQYRGKTARFPMRALIVSVGISATANRLLIFDLDKKGVPLWMEFPTGSTGAFTGRPMHGAGGTSISAKNGFIYTCSNVSNAAGYGVIDFIKDVAYAWDPGQSTTIAYKWQYIATRANISQWIQTTEFPTTGNALQPTTVNAMVMRYTPPNFSRFKLPNPTVMYTRASGSVVILKPDMTFSTSSSVATGYWTAPDPATDDAYMGIGGTTYKTNVTRGMVASWALAETIAQHNYSARSPTQGMGAAAVGPNAIMTMADEIGWPVARMKYNRMNARHNMFAWLYYMYNTGYLLSDNYNSNVQVLAVADSLIAGMTTGAITPATQVVNVASGSSANFGTGTSSAVGNEVTVTTGVGSANRGVWQVPLTGLTVGRSYVLICKATSGAVGATVTIYGAAGLSGPRVTNTLWTDSVKGISFVASATTMYAGFYTLTSSSTSTIECDTLYYDTPADRSTLHHAVYFPNSITRSPVETNADTLCYSGFSAANSVMTDESSSFEIGTGNFAAWAWFKLSDNTQYSPIFSYDVGTNAGWMLGYNGASNRIEFTMASGTPQTYSITIPNGVWCQIVMQRRGTNVDLFLNGVYLQTFASQGADISQTGAKLKMGLSSHSSLAIVPAYMRGSLALMRLAVGAYFAVEQVATMYEEEKQLFVPGAKGTINFDPTLACFIQGVGADMRSDKWTVSTSLYATSIMHGLVRLGTEMAEVNVNNYNAFPNSENTGGTGTAWTAFNTTRTEDRWGYVKLVPNTSNVEHYTYPGFNNSSLRNVQVTASCFAKAAGYTRLEIYDNTTSGGAGGFSAFFDLVAGTVIASNNCTGYIRWDADEEAWFCRVVVPQGMANYIKYIGVPDSFATSSIAAVFAGNGTDGIICGKFMVTLGDVDQYIPPRDTTSNNHVYAYISDDDLIIKTALGVEVVKIANDNYRQAATFKDNLVEPMQGVRGIHRAYTTDATPLVIARVPIPRDSAALFEAQVTAVQYDATTEKAQYTIRGIVTRDISGNVTVNATTSVGFEITSTMDCAASADTTNQQLIITGTGKASTKLEWYVTLDTTWFQQQVA